MNKLTIDAFDRWLRDYGAAWEGKDAQAAAQLFTEDAEYYWTPFDPPQRGRDQIAQAWTGAITQQRDIRFSYEIIAVTDRIGVARWKCALTSVPSEEKVQLDGIAVTLFDDAMKCREFREWWHSVGKPY